MRIMILGLIIFLGVHATRIVADDWRRRIIDHWGDGPWKAIYSAISAVGLTLAIWGLGITRGNPIYLWHPPQFLSHVTALLMVPAFIFLIAAYVPRNHIRTRLGHPMLIAVKTWTLAHLLVNGRLAAMIFLTAFLAWAVFAFRAAKKRDRHQPPASVTPTTAATAVTVSGGLVASVTFAMYLHIWVIGVPALPMG